LIQVFSTRRAATSLTYISSCFICQILMKLTSLFFFSSLLLFEVLQLWLASHSSWSVSNCPIEIVLACENISCCSDLLICVVVTYSTSFLQRECWKLSLERLFSLDRWIAEYLLNHLIAYFLQF
jgi:hypothetical protein